MAFVDMNSVHFYQPPSMGGPPEERRSAALNLDVRAVSNESYNSMAFGPSNSSGRLEDYNSIEPLDLTVSLPRESLDLFHESTVDTRDRSHATGTTRSYCLEWWLLITSGLSDEIDRRNYEEDDNLLPLNQLLFGVGGAQELHHAQSRHDHEMGRSDATVHPLQHDCNHTTPGSKQYGAEGGDIDGSSGSSLHPSSGGPTCKASDERHCSSSTLSTSAADLEARCDP